MAKPNGKKPKGGKKNRKWGNNADFCARYRAEGRKEKNQIRRIRRHLKRYPEDLEAARILQTLVE